ncbi:MAG: DUF4239 domain-containing protein [Burkholderiales bacterium]|nr:DUF4239 domain-containing protein [Burkholderiales bacterium]
MSHTAFTLFASAILFFAMLACLEIGRRLGGRRIAADPDHGQDGTGAIEGAVYALLGLLIAFTFSGAASRFDERRNLIVQESNDVGTAWLRVDLLPATAQPAMRDLFRRYLDARLGVYRDVENPEATQAALARTNTLQGEIWAHAVAATRSDGASPAAPMLLLPALNQMFDTASSRILATKMHPPVIIFAMLFALALASALFAGYGMAGARARNWVYMIGFAAVMAGAVNVIVDLEYPRLGLIRVDTFDQALADLRKSMD